VSAVGLTMCAATMAHADPPPCGGLLQPPCPEPQPPPPERPPPEEQPPPAPSAATVTLHAARLYRSYGDHKKIKLTGTVSGAEAGSRTRIRLRSRSSAYNVQFDDVERQTDPEGRFHFWVQPPVNSTFRVEIATGEPVTGASGRVHLRVYPAVSVGFNHDDHGREDKIYLAVDAPPQFGSSTDVAIPRAGSATVGYFYAIPRHSKRAYRIGRARLKDPECDLYFCQRRAAWRIRPSERLRRAPRVLACMRGTGYVGMGARYPACGRRVIRVY
jgi:hypothetical protein